MSHQPEDKDLPCAKDCACYVMQTIEELKCKLQNRLNTFECLVQGPEWSIHLTDSECGLLTGVDERVRPRKEPEDGEETCYSSGLASAIVAREVGSRERDLECMKHLCETMLEEAEKFRPTGELVRSCLATVRSHLESAKESISRRESCDKATLDRLEDLSADQERRRIRIGELCDELIASYDRLASRRESSFPTLMRQYELDRAALNSALRALSRINEIESECPDEKSDAMQQANKDPDAPPGDGCPLCPGASCVMESPTMDLFCDPDENEDLTGDLCKPSGSDLSSC